MTKEQEYTTKIYAHLIEVFNIDSDNYISINELEEGNNATIFFHALANLACGQLYNKITGESSNALEFNHIANNLAFQFLNRV